MIYALSSIRERSIGFFGGAMLFLLGLLLGCVFGVIVACLCNVARKETPNLFTASSSPEIIEGTAKSAARAPAASPGVFTDAFDGHH